ALFKKALPDAYPIFLNVIVDDMYPLIRFSHQISIVPLPSKFKIGQIFVYWSEGKLRLSYIFSTADPINVISMNLKEKTFQTIPRSLILGLVGNFQLSIVWKIKLLFLKRF